MKFGAFLVLALTGFFSSGVLAGAIPYPSSGIENPQHYIFTATTTGHVIAYFAGSSALYQNELGMEINGTLSSSGFGLNNHTSALGSSFDLGLVNAGDTLVFVLRNLSTSGFPAGAPASLGDAYSDAMMNLAYDNSLSGLGYTTPFLTTMSIPPLIRKLLPSTAFPPEPMLHLKTSRHPSLISTTMMRLSSLPT